MPGGAFIEDIDAKRYVRLREKNIPKTIAASSIGFIGSDTYGELPCGIQQDLVFAPIAFNGARFALAARRDRAWELDGRRLRLATSYPNATERVMGRLGYPFTIGLVLDGSVEAAPYLELDQPIDAVVDLVDTGETMKTMKLEILKDNLERVELGAVWNK